MLYLIPSVDWPALGWTFVGAVLGTITSLLVSRHYHRVSEAAMQEQIARQAGWTKATMTAVNALLEQSGSSLVRVDLDPFDERGPGVYNQTHRLAHIENQSKVFPLTAHTVEPEPQTGETSDAASEPPASEPETR